MCAYGFSCSRRKRGDGGRPAGRRRPGRQRERGGRVGVVRGRGGPRPRTTGPSYIVCVRATHDRLLLDLLLGARVRVDLPVSDGRPRHQAPHARPDHAPRIAQPLTHDNTHHAQPSVGRRRTATVHASSGHLAWPVEPRSACRASLHQYHRTPQPARVTVSVRRSRPPTGHRRATGGDATTTAPSLPDRRATRGVSSRCDLQQVLAEISTNLRRGRHETATVHLCIPRNAACRRCASASL